MFWDWDSGYIMAKLEFATPQGDQYMLHVAGWKFPHSVLRWVSLDMLSAIVIPATKAPSAYIKSDVAEWLKTLSDIKFADLDSVYWPNIANNYADMFKVDRID